MMSTAADLSYTIHLGSLVKVLWGTELTAPQHAKPSMFSTIPQGEAAIQVQYNLLCFRL